MIDVSELFCEHQDDEDEEPREAAFCYQAALEFHARGMNVVPRNPERKCPAVRWKGLQDRFVTVDELKGWREMFAGGVGFITGAISNLIVIESDGPEGEAVIAEFKQARGALPQTFTVRSGSGRGLHRYFRHPGFRVTTRANTSIKLDVKGDAGFCVLPPSLHKSGGRYEIVSGVKPAPLPEGLLEFIEAEAAKAKGEAPKQHCRVLSSMPPSQAAHALGENTNRFQPVPVNPVNVAIITSMLEALPDSYADGHDDWLHVGFALHDFDDGAVGLALWKKFSERCPEKVPKAKFETRWASFGGEYSGRRKTIGSLWREASAHRWRPPRHWDRSTKIKD